MLCWKRRWSYRRRAGLVALASLILAACSTPGQAPITSHDAAPSVVASEWGIRGDGDQTTEPMNLAAGPTTITCTYHGIKDFILDIVDASGTTVEHFSSPAGANCTGLSYDLPQDGAYTLHISADGPWEINVSSDESEGVTEVR